LAAGVATAALSICAPAALAQAHAQTASANVITIEGQDLGSALRTLARQTGAQIVFDPSAVSGLRSPAVRSADPEQALRAMLAGTGLTYRSTGEGTYTILAQASGQRPTQLGAAETGASSDEEIVVTAQKREERLQDVPISVSVMSGEVLDSARMEGVTEALNTIPGVAANTAVQGGGTQVTIRGVAPGGSLFTGSSPTAYYVDGIPFGLVKSAVAPDTNAYDLERVEVLRGPQGTLYGASALNGVVRVLTHDADLEEFGFKFRTSVSTTDGGGENYRGDAAVNAPIVPGKLAVRFAAGFQDLSGWIDRVNEDEANTAELQTYRLRVAAEPTDRLSIGFSAWLSRSDYGAPSVSRDDGSHTATLAEPITTDFDAYGLRVGYDFDNVSFSSVTSLLNYDNDSQLDVLPWFGIPDAPLTNTIASEVFSQEFLLNSTDSGDWRWSLGAIYREGEDRLVQTFAFVPAPIDFTDISDSYAVFGEVTRSFLNGRVELTGGLRYFEDEVTQIENVDSSGPPDDPLIRRVSTFDALSPRVILAWHPTSDSTVYTSYSEGFRSGFNQNPNTIRTAPSLAPLRPDKLRNYEVGARGATSDGRLRFDAALFYIDWQDVQQTVTVDAGGSPIAALVNGDAASGVGFEAALSYELFDGFDVDLNYSWNDLVLDAAVISDGVTLFAAGDRLIASPETTAGAAFSYRFPVAQFEGRFTASAHYISEQQYRTVIAGALVSDTGYASTIARAAFSLESPSGWAATLFVDNLTNEDSGGPALAAVPDWSPRPRPTTVGLQLEHEF
jgi:iron complex outermembrane recepter protein